MNLVRFKRGAVYKKNYGDPFIVLAESRIGVTLVYVSKGSIWNQIPGLKIPGFGFARIETVCTKNKRWIDEKEPIEVDRISPCKYKQIIDAIQALYMGYIEDTCDERGLVYKDWSEDTKDMDIGDRSDPIETHEDIQTAEADPIVQVHEEDTQKELPENNGDLHTKYDDEADVPPDGYYDLLKGAKFSVKGYDNTSADPMKGIEDHHKQRWFSEIEVIAISCMTTEAVANRYGINYAQACYIIRNAKDIVGLDRIRFTKQYAYAKYFEQGFTAEQVASMFPENLRNRIIQCYKNWWLNNINATEEDQEKTIKKWSVPVTHMNEKELACYVYNVQIFDFCMENKCRVSIGGRLVRDIKNRQLAKNPFAVVGFDELAFDTDAFQNHIESCKFAVSIGNPTVDQEIDSIIYDEVCKVTEFYGNSFKMHADILSGIASIPEVIPTDLVPTYLMLIRNRFSIDTDNLNEEYSKTRWRATSKTIESMRKYFGMY